MYMLSTAQRFPLCSYRVWFGPKSKHTELGPLVPRIEVPDSVQPEPQVTYSVAMLL